MEKKIDFAIGGQAVIEGVMMRSPSWTTVAVRKKNGEIKVQAHPFRSLTQRVKFLKLPLLRGIVNLIEMMAVGFRALNFSADEFAADFDDEEGATRATINSESRCIGTRERGRLQIVRNQHDLEGATRAPIKEPSRLFSIASMALSLVISFAFAVFLFKFVPLFITEKLRELFPYIADHYIIFNIIDGLIRITIFLLYIIVLSFFKSFRRIFEYHGAEHMTVHAYEKGRALEPAHVKDFSPRHPRCGTSFIMVVLIISILVYSFVPRNPVFWLNLLQRIAILPLIAGIGYEILKWSAKRIESGTVKILVAPGILTQYITTKQPNTAQMEVAIAALNKALELEKQ